MARRISNKKESLYPANVMEFKDKGTGTYTYWGKSGKTIKLVKHVTHGKLSYIVFTDTQYGIKNEKKFNNFMDARKDAIKTAIEG